MFLMHLAEETVFHDVVILGTGLAGLRAALAATAASKGQVSLALVSKIHLMRAHSVCAEGGTAAVLRPEQGDHLNLHAWDTVKGSDFLADQDVVFRFVQEMPKEILFLDRHGMPWSRRPDGRINQRPFGGHSYPRATFAADKTGFFEMQTLYDALLGYGANFTRYDEHFATGILLKDGKFAGVYTIDLQEGKVRLIMGKALIIATGGAGRIFGFTTYSHSVTGDGLAMAYRIGLPLEDMEFIQFHPTGLIPSGILMTEACRGEGGYLRNAEGERFMSRYAPDRMELAPRDVVSRSMMTEIEEGRGFEGPDGLDYIHLDLTHLGEEKINERLPMIRDLVINFLGIDPVKEPIPVRPVAHYSMGGIEADIDGRTRIENIWVAGEAACTSLHGANRLGSNSTAECLVWGRIAGEQAAQYAMEAEFVGEPVEDAERERARLERYLSADGSESPYAIMAELRRTMDKHFGVFRRGEVMERGLEKIRELKHRFKHVRITDKSLVYNTDLQTIYELENMLDVAEVLAAGALAREESRGAHFRRDFPKRDDERWLKHTLAFRAEDGSPRLEYKPVRITAWKPIERKY